MRLSNKRVFETTRGKVEIEVQQLDGMSAGKLSLRLIRLTGSAMARIGAASEKDAGAAFAGAVGDVVDRLTEQEFEDLTKILLDGAAYSTGKEFVEVLPAAGDLFRGHVKELFALLKFALEVNFSDFFGDLAGAFKAALAKQGLGSLGTSTSSGPPNA